MAYRYEKEANGDTALVIDGWEKGIAPDPYSGTGRMVQVDLAVPGTVSLGYVITQSTTSGGTLGIPIHDATSFLLGSASAYYILDATSQVWKATSLSGTWTFLSTSNTTTGATATNQGLAYWKGVLFKFRNSSIDYLVGGSGTWVTGWKPSDGTSGVSGIITADVNHYALVSQDDALYFCNGTTVGSILEVPGSTFDPTAPSTYTFNESALQLPVTEQAQSLAEQGVQLLVGGSFNTIYPWDRISTSYTYPIFIGDNYIKRMVTVNTNVYIFPGNQNGRGRIYVTNGSQVNLYFKIPDYIFGENDPYYDWGDAIFHRNNLIFSFFANQNSGSGTLFSSNVWAIDLDTDAFRAISSIPADGAKGNATVLISGYGSAPGMNYILGWRPASGNNGIGYSGTTVGTGGSYDITTEQIPVGSYILKKTYSQVEIKLQSPLASGESFSIVGIVDTSGTVLASGTFASLGAIISFVTPVNFENAQWLGFQFIATGNSANSGVRLREIRVR